jgi:hypothetical protein
MDLLGTEIFAVAFGLQNTVQTQKHISEDV